MDKHKHPLCIRWNHWLNFPILFVMIWSGFLIYWANPVFGLPRSWLASLGWAYRLGEGISWHFVFAWLFVINGVIYTLYLAISGSYKDLFPTREDLKNIPQVILHDIGLRKEAPPQLKYNAAQKLAYTMVIFYGIGSTLTGIAIYKPVQFQWLLTLLGGYNVARGIHFLLTWLFLFFFLGHVLQVIRAGWLNFQSMVTGFEKIINPQKYRRSILKWGVGMLLLIFGLWAIHTSEKDRGVSWPLRQGLNLQGAFWQSVFREGARAKKVTPDKKLRVNGTAGMLEEIDIHSWRLNVTDAKNKSPLQLSLEEIKKLPVTTASFEFKCIEGWSQLMECTGVRFKDLIDHVQRGYKGREMPFPYVGISTVDEGYFVSIDAKTFLHPQTVLCYEMNGEPLPMEHGYPLRLATPLKYGVKQIKQIGSMHFSDTIPADYWAQKGYDDYLGL